MEEANKSKSLINKMQLLAVLIQPPTRGDLEGLRKLDRPPRSLLGTNQYAFIRKGDTGRGNVLITLLGFLSDQCKEIEENNRMRKTRDLFKKIRDTKGTFHAKIGSIKDRNGMDLTEAEDIKKRWQEYTEELYKKDLHDPDNHDGVITLLEPDFLECEVKWAL